MSAYSQLKLTFNINVIKSSKIEIFLKIDRLNISNR